MRNFILEYDVRQRRLPSQHVIVFDEAQRAWDLDYVRSKHDVAFSEPQMLLDIASRLPGWAVVIGLVGEGQEIHLGEEAGILRIGPWYSAQPSDPESCCQLRQPVTEFQSQGLELYLPANLPGDQLVRAAGVFRRAGVRVL